MAGIVVALVLTLVSACALNVGYLIEYSVASKLPPLSLRRPIASLRLLLRPRALGLDRGVAGLHDAFERLALVRRVALDRLDEVRDQIVPAFELHLDLRPRGVDAIAQANEAVVHHDEHDGDQDNDRDDDPYSHVVSPVVQ